VRKLILSVTATAAALLVPALVIAAVATASTTTERFSLADAKASNGPPVWSVIATGHFIAGGTATQKRKGVLMLHFSAGTITLKIGNNHKKLSKDQTATACIQTQTGSGTYTIAAGTGAYRGIAGSGRATLHNTFVEDAANGHCSNAVAAVQSLITASGPVLAPSPSHAGGRPRTVARQPIVPTCADGPAEWRYPPALQVLPGVDPRPRRVPRHARPRARLGDRSFISSPARQAASFTPCPREHERVIGAMLAARVRASR
jgi:hypothetical protein